MPPHNHSGKGARHPKVQGRNDQASPQPPRRPRNRPHNASTSSQPRKRRYSNIEEDRNYTFNPKRHQIKFQSDPRHNAQNKDNRHYRENNRHGDIRRDNSRGGPSRHNGGDREPYQGRNSKNARGIPSKLELRYGHNVASMIFDKAKQKYTQYTQANPVSNSLPEGDPDLDSDYYPSNSSPPAQASPTYDVHTHAVDPCEPFSTCPWSKVLHDADVKDREGDTFMCDSASRLSSCFVFAFFVLLAQCEYLREQLEASEFWKAVQMKAPEDAGRYVRTANEPWLTYHQ